jgi:hypothetical protein
MLTLIVSRQATIKRLLLFIPRVYNKWVFKLYSIKFIHSFFFKLHHSSLHACFIFYLFQIQLSPFHCLPMQTITQTITYNFICYFIMSFFFHVLSHNLCQPYMLKYHYRVARVQVFVNSIISYYTRRYYYTLLPSLLEC